MAEAQVVLPDKKVHQTVLADPPERLVTYLNNKLDMKQPLEAAELRDNLSDILQQDEARFQRITSDIHRIYRDIYTQQGDPDGQVDLNAYREAIAKRTSGTPDYFEKELPGVGNPGLNPPTPPIDGYKNRPDKEGGKTEQTESEKDKEIFYYQIAVGALALFLLIKIAK